MFNVCVTCEGLPQAYFSALKVLTTLPSVGSTKHNSVGINTYDGFISCFCVHIGVCVCVSYMPDHIDEPPTEPETAWSMRPYYALQYIYNSTYCHISTHLFLFLPRTHILSHLLSSFLNLSHPCFFLIPSTIHTSPIHSPFSIPFFSTPFFLFF